MKNPARVLEELVLVLLKHKEALINPILAVLLKHG